MEASKGFVGLLLVAGVLMGLLVDSTGAYVFYAGGRDGWVLHPSERYRDWAGRNRFQVNDTIVFRYKKGSDSVLVVTKQDYDACDVSKPIQKLDGGDSVFKIDRSGPFYFISGAPGKCRQGQKLVVVVMAVRQPPSEPPVPSPASPPHHRSIANSGRFSFPFRFISKAQYPSSDPAAISAPPCFTTIHSSLCGVSSSDFFRRRWVRSGASSLRTSRRHYTSSSSSLNAFKMPAVLIALVMLGASFLA
ncbi:unnamed protein product [Musa textilis]